MELWGRTHGSAWRIWGNFINEDGCPCHVSHPHSLPKSCSTPLYFSRLATMSNSKQVPKDTITTVELEEVATTTEYHLDSKVDDGDDALKILNTHYEPFTPEEEKKVLRKIDRRMVVLMLCINGIQFIE